MPVEIKELIVRVAVDDTVDRRVDEPQRGPDTTAIVEECVRQVLRLLKRQRER